jgi:WD40 repeat protein
LTGGLFSERGEVVVWDAESGARLSTFAVRGLRDSVAFSQDGEWLTGVGLTGEAVVWQANSGQVVFRQTFRSPVTSAAFGPNDTVLAIGTENGEMYITPWRTDRLIVAACERLRANLTCDEKYHATCSALSAPSKCD